MPVVKKVRTCVECKRTFANPESVRTHRYRFGGCRSEESLIAAGFKLTPKGWLRVKMVTLNDNTHN
jgi:hypothetical protein